MALVFHPPREAIELALQKLKDDGVVHPDAEFNESAEGGLRREVTYRDIGFGYRLGRTTLECEIADAALDLLKSRGLVSPSADYDRAAFEGFRAEVKEKFTGSWTSMSPTMERLIYMLTSARRPSRLVELGSFWGYTLAWFAGPCVGSDRTYTAEKIYGVDVNAEMTEQARRNFAKLENCDEVELMAEDARLAVEHMDGPIDFLYIEAKYERGEVANAPDGPSGLGPTRGLYLILLKKLYDKLPAGAWVMAHDNLDWTARDELEDYLTFVRDPAHFRESICFDIDNCGMELSIK